MREVDICIIGGGSAGMAAAISAYDAGVKSILILERDVELGGILEQCIHNGFGLQVFKEELSGPSFAERLVDEVQKRNIEYKLETTVVRITSDRHVEYVNEKEGDTWVVARAVILASGCSERNRGAISIPGMRVKGVYTAGAAQKYLNIENILVGKRVFILGSGDIGLIMARRMSLEGAKVLGVAEIMPYSNGLMRNIVQCLEDFDIPLYLSHTVTNIKGNRHVESVVIEEVDENRVPIPGTAKEFACDTLLLSVGLVPDNVLAFKCGVKLDPRTKGAIVNERLETSIPRIYACGNSLHVHDLVDFVTLESRLAGRYAAEDILNGKDNTSYLEVTNGEGISYVLPQKISVKPKEDITFSFRVKKPYKASILEFVDRSRVVKTIKKRYLLPQEMERVKLSLAEMEGLENLEVRVREEI